MAKEFFGVRATTALSRLVKAALAEKQDKVEGTDGDILMFNAEGKLEASSGLKDLLSQLQEI